MSQRLGLCISFRKSKTKVLEKELKGHSLKQLLCCRVCRVEGLSFMSRGRVQPGANGPSHVTGCGDVNTTYSLMISTYFQYLSVSYIRTNL